MMRSIYLLIISLGLLSACGNPKELSPEDYTRWISLEENGLLKSKEVNHVVMTARFLPAEYLAYKEYLNDGNLPYDSVVKTYKCGMTFQLTLQADKTGTNYPSLMYFGIGSQEELTARTRYLNFQIADFISLKMGDVEYEPVLSHFEGYDAVGNKLVFQVVFEIQEFKCGDVTSNFNDAQLVFDDPIWGLGTNNFIFEKKRLTSIPKVKI